MRIGCLQFAPKLGDVNNNLNRADAVLSKANPENLDLLCLPELSFTGYNFKSLQQISPFLEPQGSGVSALWARTVALKYNCVTIVGYPETCDVKAKWPTSPEYYNSAIIINGEGETIGNYRKSFLYYTDETWALEGQDGFWQGSIPGLGNTSLGICMDINPYKFEAPFHAFEFAFHILEMESNLVVLTMAWLTREDGRMFSRMPNDPDLDTLTYWVTRLEPLIRAETEEEIIVVFANRCGIEDDAVYAGTSAVIGIKDGEVNVYGMLGRGEKELLIVDTEAAPYAKLVYRPDDNASVVASTDDESKGGSGRSSTKPSGGGPSGRSGKPQSPKGNDSTNAPTNQTPKGAGPSDAVNNAAQPISPLSEATLASYEQISPNGIKDYDYVPLGRGPRAGSDGSTKSIQGSVVSKHSASSKKSRDSRASRKSGGSSLTRTSKGGNGSKVSSSHRSSSRKAKAASSIQIPPRNIASDAVLTPTAPSPTPLAIRPKLIIPKDAHRRAHIPTPHPDVGPRGYGRAYDSYVSRQLHKAIVTPTTAFDDLSPQFPSRSFWAPSDPLLHTPAESRGWTPASDDSLQPLRPGSESRPRATEKAPRNSEPKPTAKDNRPMPDLSSPKSRNASRSRKLGRSDPAPSQRHDSTTIVRRLESPGVPPDPLVGRRAGTPSSHPSSALTRRNPTDASVEQRYHDAARASILIGASASILDNSIPRDPPDTSRPDGRIGNIESTYRVASRVSSSRSNSISASYTTKTPILPESDGNSSRPRAISRGRQRIPKGATGIPDYEDISGSIPTRPISPEWSVRGDLGSEEDDEIVEEIIVRRSPSCAIHGDRHVRTDGPGRESNISPRDANGKKIDSRRATPRSKEPVESENVPKILAHNSDSEFRISAPSNESSAPTLTPAEDSPGLSRFLFNPKTPIAMVFDADGEGATPAVPRSAPFADSLKLAACIGQEAISKVRPKSAVW